MSALILETVIYRAKPGVNPALALQKIESVLDPLLRAQPGLEWVRRSRSDDGAMVDNVLWKDESAFLSAQRAERAEPALRAVFDLFEDASLVMLQARVFKA